MAFDYKEYHKKYRETHREEQAAYKKQWNESHKEYMHQYRVEHLERHKRLSKIRRDEQKVRVLSHYSTSNTPNCAKCGIDDIDVLTIDHINGGGSKQRRQIKAVNSIYYWLDKNKLPDGYQVLCANCNQKKRIIEGL